MASLLKTIFLLPFRVLIFIWSSFLVLNGCKSKEKNPISGFIKSDQGEVVYRSAFLGLLSLQDHPIIEADHATFTILNRHYAKDKKYAYYHQYFFSADAGTFEALDGNFAKDKNRVYFENREIPEADPATVEFLPREGFLIRDKERVYYQDKLLSRDAAHFAKLGQLTGTYKSADVVLVAYNVLPEADPATFDLIDSSASDYYFADKRRVYFNGIEIKGADTKSFVPLNKSFAKDKNRVYCYDRPIPEADYPTFEVVDEAHAKDKFRQYSADEAGKEEPDDGNSPG